MFGSPSATFRGLKRALKGKQAQVETCSTAQMIRGVERSLFPSGPSFRSPKARLVLASKAATSLNHPATDTPEGSEAGDVED